MSKQRKVPARARGGKARAEALTPRQRSAISARGGKARHRNEFPKATHEGAVQIGELNITCAVLDDEANTRVLSERGVLKQLGITRGGALLEASATENGGARLPLFLAHRNLRPFIDNELAVVTSEPIVYRPMAGGRTVYGLDASLIPKVCEVWLRARDAGALRGTHQVAIAARADMLMRGLAKVGIIALVDEATGFQEVRDRHALAAILEQFIAKELAAWVKRFPDDFYRQMYRLRNWKWKGNSTQRTHAVAKYTNNLVYRRLVPELLAELEAVNPKDERGRRAAKHHQWLTHDVGHPVLAQHLHAVVALMRASDSWEGFMESMDRALPIRSNLDDLPIFQDSPDRDRLTLPAA